MLWSVVLSGVTGVFLVMLVLQLAVMVSARVIGALEARGRADHPNSD